MVDVVKYVVKTDDSLWNIMKTSGFPPKDWKKVLDAKYNSKFKNKLKKEKRSPHLIYKGEVFFLPAYNPAQIKGFISILDSHYKSLARSENAIKQLDSAVKRIGEDKKKNEKLLKEAQKQLKSMSELDDLRFEKSAGGREKGVRIAKMIAHFRDKRSLALEKYTLELQQEIWASNSKEVKNVVKLLKNESVKASKDLKNIDSAIMKMRDLLSKNMNNPY